MKILNLIMLIISAIVCTSCTPTPTFAYTLQGTVAYVYDGDTIKQKAETCKKISAYN